MNEKFFNELVEHVRLEREYQDNKWGTESDDRNTMNDWAVFIMRYVAKATPQRELGDDHGLAFTQNMIKVAALAFAALEAEDRNGGMPPRHYDEQERG